MSNQLLSPHLCQAKPLLGAVGEYVWVRPTFKYQNTLHQFENANLSNSINKSMMMMILNLLKEVLMHLYLAQMNHFSEIYFLKHTPHLTV
jgi:hypothetical protein